jgi:hypothetical protein
LLKGYVLMLLQDQDTDRGSDRTYSQEDLVNEMAGQLVRLEDAVSLINQKCNDLAVQLEHRERIDQDQQSALTKQQAMLEKHSAENRKLYRGIRGLIFGLFSGSDLRAGLWVPATRKGQPYRSDQLAWVLLSYL